MRRSPPTDIPCTPTSHPLMTSPTPILNVNGLPFLFATSSVSSDNTNMLKNTHNRKLYHPSTCQYTAFPLYLPFWQLDQCLSFYHLPSHHSHFVVLLLELVRSWMALDPARVSQRIAPFCHLTVVFHLSWPLSLS